MGDGERAHLTRPTEAIMRNGVKFAVSAWGLLLTTTAAMAQAPPQTVGDLVMAALERNRELQAARARVAEAQGLLRRAGVRPNPLVEIDYGTGQPVGSPGTDEVSVRYVHPIELGGKRGKRQAIGQSGVAVAEAEVAERTRQLGFDVKSRAAELRAARAKSAALADVVTAGRESLRLMRARVGEGDAAALEAQLLAVEIARVEAQQATYRGRATAALFDLRRVVGLDVGEITPLPDAPPASVPAMPADLTARALETRADLRAARAVEQQATAELVLARAEGVPDLAASATYTQDTDTTDDFVAFTSGGSLATIVDRDKRLSVGVSIPVFTRGRNQGNVEAALARATSARLHREFLEVAVPQEVEAAYARWAAAQQTLAVFRQGVIDQADQNLVVMREAYTLGQLRLIDVLNEQRRLVDTRFALIDAETELAQAAAALERAVGTDLQ
jgi:cobalt-zinc-cadmium efflux system outer membrane protein